MEVEENVQIDHMTVTQNGVVMKHFGGIERRREHVYANVYCKANSANATKFLRELIENAPYKVRSIQVDEGSELMKDFEDACKDWGSLYLFYHLRNQRIMEKSNEVTGFFETNSTQIPLSEPAENS